jgi:hypothetical protein
MIRLLSAASLVFLLTNPAWAICVSRPDSAASGYVRNGEAKTICQQDELSDRNAIIEYKAQFDSLNNQFTQFQIEDRFKDLTLP